MKRKIIRIDEEKCDGCGLCVSACAEGAIALIDGKARLVSETYCDGLGACLGDCPRGAITLEEREASGFDAAAVEKHLAHRGEAHAHPTAKPLAPAGHGHGHACPGSAMRAFTPIPKQAAKPAQAAEPETDSQLGHWPVQLMLVPPTAPFLKGADLVICADCVPFAVPDFHARYLQGRAVVVGCPKLDDLAFYREKLTALFMEARPSRVTILRMEVPCCSGIAKAAVSAAEEACLAAPVEVHVIGIRGGIRTEAAA